MHEFLFQFHEKFRFLRVREYDEETPLYRINQVGYEEKGFF